MEVDHFSHFDYYYFLEMIYIDDTEIQFVQYHYIIHIIYDI